MKIQFKLIRVPNKSPSYHITSGSTIKLPKPCCSNGGKPSYSFHWKVYSLAVYAPLDPMLPVSLNSSYFFPGICLRILSQMLTMSMKGESKVLSSPGQLVGEKANIKRRGNPSLVLSCAHCPPCSFCKIFTTRRLTKALTTFVISSLGKAWHNMIIRQETKKQSPSRN